MRQIIARKAAPALSLPLWRVFGRFGRFSATKPLTPGNSASDEFKRVLNSSLRQIGAGQEPPFAAGFCRVVH
jgi:hypothetical protein